MALIFSIETVPDTLLARKKCAAQCTVAFQLFMNKCTVARWAEWLPFCNLDE